MEHCCIVDGILTEWARRWVQKSNERQDNRSLGLQFAFARSALSDRIYHRKDYIHSSNTLVSLWYRGTARQVIVNRSDERRCARKLRRFH